MASKKNPEKNFEKNSGEKFEVVVVRANDWCHYEDIYPADHGFDLIDGLIVGFVLEEDDDKIVLAHQIFGGDTVRHITVINADDVLERYSMRLARGE